MTDRALCFLLVPPPRTLPRLNQAGPAADTPTPTVQKTAKGPTLPLTPKANTFFSAKASRSSATAQRPKALPSTAKPPSTTKPLSRTPASAQDTIYLSGPDEDEDEDDVFQPQAQPDHEHDSFIKEGEEKSLIDFGFGRSKVGAGVAGVSKAGSSRPTRHSDGIAGGALEEGSARKRMRFSLDSAEVQREAVEEASSAKGKEKETMDYSGFKGRGRYAAS